MNKEKDYRSVLVTGGAGFIGSNFIRYWFSKYPDDIVYNYDVLTYAGNLNNLTDVSQSHKENYQFILGNITDYEAVEMAIKKFKPEIVVNFAAESHNSWAIINPSIFFKTNVIGTQTLLEVCRKNNVPRFHHISTCEVYGDLKLNSTEIFSETSPFRPNSPYNASKASSDLAVRAYWETYHLPVTISTSSNNYGPYQFPEKLIPLFATNLLDNKKVPIYKSSQNRREWLHVIDHCRAIDLVLHKGRIGETYNIGGGIEKSVEEITKLILNELNLPDSMKVYVEDRPSLDQRYLLDSSKARSELGWKPEIDLDKGIKETVLWYRENRTWWESLKEKTNIVENKWDS